LVSVISYHRNILGIMQQSKYCEIQTFSNLTLNLIVTEGLFQHTARANLPHIILLLDLFLQLFLFHIFVPRSVANPASLIPYALIIPLFGVLGVAVCFTIVNIDMDALQIFSTFNVSSSQVAFECLVLVFWTNLI